MVELELVIPVFNEEEIVEKVLTDWAEALGKLNIDFRIVAFNDGSTDNTLKKLNSSEAKIAELKVVDKENSGHGPTILRGYTEADAQWVFQVDSDNEMSPDMFSVLWGKRGNYDFLLGVRKEREQPLLRRLVSLFSKITVNLFYGKGIEDVNTPYRLMRNEAFADIYRSIPEGTFAPNVILSGMSIVRNMRVCQIHVPTVFRSTGEVSIKLGKLFWISLKSWFQTVSYALFKRR